jgi:hypothetical protein
MWTLVIVAAMAHPGGWWRSAFGARLSTPRAGGINSTFCG